MLQTLLTLGAFVAFAYAQCEIEGNTYVSGDFSVTFGVQVGSVIPALHNTGNGLVWFGTWRAATTTRWEVLNVGVSQPVDSYCTTTGQYDVSFSSDCSSIIFRTISDGCADRKGLLDGASVTMVGEQGDGSDCTTPTTRISAILQQSASSPRLSEEVATIIFGNDEFAIVSVGSQAAIFQRWHLSTKNNIGEASVVDLGSTPNGLSCSTTLVGTYQTGWSTDGKCSVRLCGLVDSCESRAQLFHGAPLNGFDGQLCTTEVRSPVTAVGSCNPSGGQWLKHPWDCTDQQVEGGCMFCKGLAQGKTVSLCLDREGAQCNDVFESAAGRSWCNLEFECPASTSATGLMLVVLVAIVSLVFF